MSASYEFSGSNGYITSAVSAKNKLEKALRLSVAWSVALHSCLKSSIEY